MNIIDAQLSELVSFQRNPRKISEARLASLAESLRSLGAYSPLVVRRAGDRWEILAGNARYRAMLLLRDKGEDVGPVRCVEFVGDERLARLLLVRDNQHDGEWAWDRLANILTEYAEEDMGNLSTWTGFDERTLADLIAVGASASEALGSTVPSVAGTDPLVAGTDPMVGPVSDAAPAAELRHPVDPTFRPDQPPPATTRFVLGAVRGRVPLHVHGDLLAAFERIASVVGTDVNSIINGACDIWERRQK